MEGWMVYQTLATPEDFSFPFSLLLVANHEALIWRR